MGTYAMTQETMNVDPFNVAFCENGAGYGGAIISLAAFLSHLPTGLRPFLYTSLNTAPYRKLSELASWRHLRPVEVFDRSWLGPRSAWLSSQLDNAFNLLPYAVRYYRAFKAQGIDLVYLNNDCSCNLAAALGARMAGLPLVLHARGFNANTRSNRWVVRQLDHCIAVSQAVRTELLELGLPAAKCTVVPEGLDLELFYPRPASASLRAELGLDQHTPVVTLVGGLIDWKGQDVLLDAAPSILAEFPTASILLVGSAYGRDNTFAQDITRRIEQSALRGRVRLLGARQDIPDILALSSVVLHASTKPEPFGRTFLEGMAMGRPTIASAEGGPLDVIQHEVDGLLIAPRDPALLAQAVNHLLSSPAYAAQLGANAARKARAFSIQQHAEAIARVLHTIRKARLRPD